MMKRKSIILPAIAGLVILTSAGALTFAANTNAEGGTKQGHMRMGGGFGGMGSGMKDKSNGIGFGIGVGAQGMKNLSETDRQSMMDLVQKAIDAKDYNAFKEAHTKYGITLNMTESQFNTMITKRVEMDQKRTEKDALRTKIQEAIKNGNFATRKTLNKDMPILKYIDTKEKFTKLQEMESYRTKIESISNELGLLQGPHGKGMGRHQK